MVFGLTNNQSSSSDAGDRYWREHATNSKALVPSWFKESFRSSPYISWLPFSDCSPLVRACALTVALLVVYFTSMCIVTYPGALTSASEPEYIGDWIGQCFMRFWDVFLLLPAILAALSFGTFWLLLLFSVAFAGEEHYVPTQFAVFITVVLAMLSLIVMRFTPLLKMITSRRFIFGATWRVKDPSLRSRELPSPIRDIVLTVITLLH